MDGPQLDEHPLQQIAAEGKRPDSRATMATVAAGALIALGVVLMVSGWYGASDSTNPGDQLPYFASGTLPGVVLVLVGSAMLTRRESARSRSELESLNAKVDVLLEWMTAPPEAPAASNRRAARQTEASDD